MTPRAKTTTAKAPRPRFFKKPQTLRTWLQKNHARADALTIGFYKKGAAASGISYGEALDEALCFGWIDGVRHRLDDDRYTIRFTPRKRRSKWSLINTRRFRQLDKLGLVSPAGRAAFARREQVPAHEYSYASRPQQLPPQYANPFRRDRAAWRYFEAQPPSYRSAAAYWITSAKREETRQRRLDALIAASAAARRLPMLSGGKAT